MTRVHKLTNLIGVGVPPLALIAAIVLLWHKAVGPLQLAVLAVLYVLTALGITLGYHRLFTHRSFETSRPVRAIIAVLGGMAVEGSVITWVSDHRKHHAYTDQDGDPHSPHLHGEGFWGSVHGLWHAHCGWLFESVGLADRNRFAPDLMRDPMIRAIDKLFFVWIALGLAIPFGLGWLIGGTLGAALTTLLWAGAVRILLLHHVTWSINSVCHFFGRRRFDVEDESTNVFWLAPFSMGEAWHHNHHAFPTSAYHGLARGERLTDPTGLLITLMEKLGLIWNVVRVSEEKQRAKLVDAAHGARTSAAHAKQTATVAATNAKQTAAAAATSAKQTAATAATNVKQSATAAATSAKLTATTAAESAMHTAANAADAAKQAATQAASSGAIVRPAPSSASQ